MKIKKNLPRYLGTSLIVLTVIFLAIELSLSGSPVASLEEGKPILSQAYALRSLFFMVASAITIALVHQQAVYKKQRQTLLLAEQQLWSNRQKTVAWISLFAVLFSLGLLFFQPATFSYLAQEDVLIEPLSALFLFASSAVFVSQAWRVCRQKISNRYIIVVGLCILALILFFIAMEEVSWFQRVAKFETPDAFSLNAQGEFNLHNFATDRVEYAFYTGTFFYLIVLPFLHLTSVIPKRFKGLENFIGGSFTLCLSSIFVAYNYDMWNAFPTQLSYFLTIFMLSSLCVLSRSAQVKRTFAVFIVTLIITQIVFLWLGGTTSRIWDVTEYKEGFIAFSFFLYSLDVRNNLSLLQKLDCRD